jgi:acyl carrier protein
MRQLKTWGNRRNDGDSSEIHRTRDVTACALAVISDQLGVEHRRVTPRAHLQDDLGADSMAQVELVLALEEAFDIEIPNDDAEQIYRVQDAVDCVIHRVPAQLVH